MIFKNYYLKPIDGVVILYELVPTPVVIGSDLVVLMIHFTFYDAYGYKFDEELLWINIKNRRQLNELIPYLSNLLKNNKYEYNKVRYQHMDNETNTCGDHVCFFLYNLLNNKMGFG
jgi:hypothetical protein